MIVGNVAVYDGVGVNGRKKDLLFFWKTTEIIKKKNSTVFPNTAKKDSAVHTCTIVAVSFSAYLILDGIHDLDREYGDIFLNNKAMPVF